jgi:hypothetical protein
VGCSEQMLHLKLIQLNALPMLYWSSYVIQNQNRLSVPDMHLVSDCLTV